MGNVHFSGKEPHQYAGDSYANEDKSWGLKARKNQATQRTKPEMLADGKMAWGLILLEGSVPQAGRMIDFSGEKHTQWTSTP